MQPTSDRIEQSVQDDAWQAPLEADPADAQEQTRNVIDDVGDPEAPVIRRPSSDLDLSRASEGDLAEQLYEVPLDDEQDR